MSKMHKASELQSFLRELGVDARKGLSQNFLIDGNILRKIAASAHVKTGDYVLEIGPGPGALTELLLEQGAHVTAIELDVVFAKALERLQTQDQRLTVFTTDFLKFPLQEFLKKNPGPWKVVANLPYHITTPILTQILPCTPAIESVTIMVQKEVGKRMVSSPGSSDYGSFSVFVSFYSKATYCFTVEPTCFYPKPTVQSAVVHCQLHPAPQVSSVDAFFILTRTAFQQRRKMLRSSLKELYLQEKIVSSLLQLGLKETVRPEELSLNQFLQLFSLLN
jgi:16S rRNA (adenine1518-N6/adenine1519-N6)-dimethyltransferase